MAKKKKRRKNRKLIRATVISLALLVLLSAAAYFLNIAAEKRTYKLTYGDTVARMAAEYDVDPFLAAAVIHCESSNNKNAVSSVGAMGLMQVMPDTGAWIAGKLDMENFTEEQLFDPEVNIRMGCWYLNYLHKKFDNDTTLVLAAYNAGPGHVEKWLQDEKYSQDGELIKIPFPETDRYVVKEQRAYEKYLMLYNEELS